MYIMFHICQQNQVWSQTHSISLQQHALQQIYFPGIYFLNIEYESVPIKDSPVIVTVVNRMSHNKLFSIA